MGVKPVFTCEYGAPFTWDWAMYRGWYKGERTWGSARIPWEFCFAEWNAQFLGDRAFQISEPEKTNLRWEAKQFRAGNALVPLGLSVRDRLERASTIGTRCIGHVPDGQLAGLPDVGPVGELPVGVRVFWRLRDGVDKRRQALKVDWENLQRPGFSPDYIDERYERMDLAYEPPTGCRRPTAQALLRNNQPLLAYIGGKPAAFTSKDHNFLPGETVEKQLIIINNSRADRSRATARGRSACRRPEAGRRRSA